MGIDYVLERPCTPKQQLGTDRLVALVKARSRADAVLDMLRSRGDQRPTEELTFEMHVRTPEGVTKRSVSVQSLFDDAEPLEEHRPHCGNCAADRDAGGFGCYRTINYPISEATEEWLMSRLPSTLDCTAGRFLLRALNDFSWNGEHAARMRKDGDTFFESRIPLGIRWGTGEGAVELSSDQVFHMLFHVGHLSPTHCLMMTMFFGILPHQLDAPVLRTPGELHRMLDETVVPNPSEPSARGMAQFLATLALAARYDQSILIDG